MGAEYYFIAEQLKQQSDKTGEQIDFCIEAASHYDAHVAIRQFADALGRTYQELELEAGKKYFEIVNHDDDKINVTIYFKVPVPQKTFMQYWDDERIRLERKMQEVERQLKAEAVAQSNAEIKKAFMESIEAREGEKNAEENSKAVTDPFDDRSGEIDRDFEEVEDKTGDVPWEYVVIKGRYYDVEKREPVDIREMRDEMLGTIAKMTKKDEEIKKEIEHSESEIKRILTNSKLADMEVKVSQKRKYKKDDVLQLIREAHSIGKGEFKWNG